MFVNYMDDDNNMKEDSYFVAKHLLAVPPKMTHLRWLQMDITYNCQKREK